jgi:excisionase family DNA binding protein
VTVAKPEPDLHLRPPSEWPPFLTLEEVATILRVARSSAYEMAKVGAIPTVRFSGRGIRVPRGSLAKLAGGQFAGERLASVAAGQAPDLQERAGGGTVGHTADDQV